MDSSHIKIFVLSFVYNNINSWKCFEQQKRKKYFVSISKLLNHNAHGKMRQFIIERPFSKLFWTQFLTISVISRALRIDVLLSSKEFRIFPLLLLTMDVLERGQSLAEPASLNFIFDLLCLRVGYLLFFHRYILQVWINTHSFSNN